MDKKYKIYGDYIKKGPNETVETIAERYGVSRRAVYQAIDQVRAGSVNEFKVCTADLRLHCLWQTKYCARFKTLNEMPKTRAVTDELCLMYRNMVDDGFTPYRIAKLTNKDNATIRHHLKRTEQ